MKLIISPSVEKRPFKPVLLAIVIVGFIGLWLVGANWLVTRSPIGQVIFLLARVGFRHIPPVLWIGAMFIVTLWLAALRRVWRN